MIPLVERKHPLVLAIDDDRSERFLISQALERSDFIVESAASGQEALSLFSSVRPDIVLLDVEMPDMDGFETCRQMRALPDGRRIPILMVTGLTDEDSIDLAYEAGATDFITKPLNWTILGRRVRYMLRAAKVFRENDALLRALPDTIYRLSSKGTVLDSTQGDHRHTVFGGNNPIGSNVEELFPRQTADLVNDAIARANLSKSTQNIELRLTGDRVADFEIRLESIDRGDTLAIVRDITLHKRNERLTARLAKVLDHSSNEIYIFDARTLNFVQVNWRASENSGYPIEELSSLSFFDIMPDIGRDQLDKLAEPLWSHSEEYITFQTKNRRKNGSPYPVEVLLHLSSDEVPPVYVAVVQDITERQKANERIRYLAYYDPLTSLPNRALFNENLKFVLKMANRNNHQVAVLFIDIDRFKFINDTLGHTVGDLLLKTLAERLRSCLRDTDMFMAANRDDESVNLARLGGDEFIVLLSNISKDFDPARVARRIMSVVSQPCLLDGHEVTVTPSIGIAIYPRDGRDIESLLKHADVAMYNAKQKGKNNFQFYMNTMNEKALDRLRLEGSLRKAVENEELELYYQPQVHLGKRKVIGLEALVRWNHPERGLVSPGEFIPLAEETGLIVSIGDWVLRTACIQARRWYEEGVHDVVVSVNLSSQQFRQNRFIANVAATIDETGVDPKLLGLELTESTIMSNAVETVETLLQLKSMGIKLSVDDFGTGYSSLSYLKQFPLDVLKVDRSFIKDVTVNEDDARIVTAIMNMAKGLGMHVIAEGVETPEQFHFLMEQGGKDTAIQGYLFGRPLPVGATSQLLKEGLVLPPELAIQN